MGKGSAMDGAEPLGIIVGQGELPFEIIKNAKERGRKVVAVLLESLADESIGEHADIAKVFNVGKAGSVIKFLKKSGVREAVMAGKVPKTLLYQGGLKPDLRAVTFLLKLKDRKDDSILNALAREFEKDGIRFLDMKEFCGDLLTPEGVLTKKGPGKSEKKDIEFGFRMAKEIGRLDIGQTIVVKSRAVMAVEAIEGTDEAVTRGGELAAGGAVVVKVSRPNQDMRFDVPAVGLHTLERMIGVNAHVLALEAGKSIIMDRETFIEKANEAGIVVVGVSAPDSET